MNRTRRPTPGLAQRVLTVLIPAVVIVTLGFSVLVYRDLNRAISDGFDRLLIATSAVTGALIPADPHQSLLNEVRTLGRDPLALETDPRYRDLVTPMRAIRERLGLTYLYTQVIGAGEHEVVYVIDTNLDADHTPIGTADMLPADAVNGMYQILGGAPHAVSPIEQWEEWGLLKSGFAPIRDATGRAVAAAGADVNVTVIRERTRIALLTVLVLGLSALSAGLIIAWLIAQRLSRPMQQLKTLAARATAGSSARLSGSTRLIPELRPVADAIDALRAHLRRSRDAAQADIQALRARRLQDSARDWLRARVAIETDSVDDQGRAALTLARRHGWRLVWLTAASPLAEDDLIGRRQRTDLIDLLRRLWEHGADDPATWPSGFGAAASRLLLPGEGSLLAVEADGRVIHLAGDPIAAGVAAPPYAQRGS